MLKGGTLQLIVVHCRTQRSGPISVPLVEMSKDAAEQAISRTGRDVLKTIETK